ncbi:MAG: RMD1 family protein [Parachlamydiaceae bacterium]|nr:RMD1 family protein [Parachlamydiaceae bacterium]
MNCLAFCVADSYRLKPLLEVIRNRYKTTLYRDVVHIELPTTFPISAAYLAHRTGTLETVAVRDDNPSQLLTNGILSNHDTVSEHLEDTIAHVFCFPYGATIFWGLNNDQSLAFLDELKRFEEQRYEDLETDEFTYIYGGACKILEDEIILPDEEILTKLAISHGIAQSVKLGVFETKIHKTFNSNKHLPEELARRGKIPLSRADIRRKMGQLFIERSSINLHLDVLDAPEFFWEYPELDPLYRMTSLYLDISTRVEILNHRLDVIHELLEMLGNELHHQHSSRLEWTIIWLIVIEVILTVAKDLLKWL